MAIWDILKSSNDKTYSLTGDSFNPDQTNALGKNLAPTTPQGDLAAVDPSTDTRNALQFKEDARTATAITDTIRDDADYHTSKAGSKYDKFDNSALQQGLTAAAQYMTNYFATGGNVGKAAQAAGSALYQMDEKEKRYSKIDELEDAGHNPLDIQKWLESGDDKDLIVNKGTWQSGGNGVMFNNLTGETKTIPGAINQNVPVKTINAGDRQILIYPDGRQEEVAKGANPTQAGLSVAGASGGGIGIDSDESQGAGTFQDPTTGQWFQRTTYANGREKLVPLSATAQKTLQEKANAGNPDANQQLVTGDLQTVNAATPEQLNRITGQVIGRSATARELASSIDPETRKVYQAGERLSGQMGNAAISAAKAAGASGINTEAEIKRFTQGVPQIDYTSEANYKNSIAKIQEYANNFRDSLIRGKGGNVAPQQPQQTTKHLSDDELLNLYGG